MSDVYFPNGASTTGLAACPANGHLMHESGSEIKVKPADGLFGVLGLFEVKIAGETKYMTRAELEAFQQTQCEGGGKATVVRSDNHRELMEQSIAQAGGRWPWDKAVRAAGVEMLDPFSAVKADFDSRVSSLGRTTVKLDGFDPPGWEEASSDTACFELAYKGAQATASKGDSPSAGRVYLYEAAEQRMRTDPDAGQVALDLIKAHIDSGRAVIAGVNEPENPDVVAATQPVTDHFVAVYGYEMDAQGRITALLAKDNAVRGTAELRFEVAADGSITKPAEPARREPYLQQEYQMSEVRYHKSMPYLGGLDPMNDAGQRLIR